MSTVRRQPLTFGLLLLAVVVAVGIGLGIVRMINGLGATTGLSDGYPWGLWIVYDVFFVPFSAGAFMILAITHIYNRREYHSIARPVVLAGFLGEVMVVAVLVMDLGRWHQFYNVLIPWYWNIRSFMFQVSICLTIYMGVMILELSPIVLERLNWQRPLRLIRTLTVLIAGAGIVLSSLHQSSLGSLFLLMPYKLHSLWWTPLLPLLFFVSAAFSGLAMAILVAGLCSKLFDCDMNLNLLSTLGRIVTLLLGVYLVLKIGDLVVAGELAQVVTQGGRSILFVSEIVVGVLIPLTLLRLPKLRRDLDGLLAASACVLLGLALNRSSVALVAQSAPQGAAYTPHWMEIVISAAAIAAGVLLFLVAVRFLPILPEKAVKRQAQLFPSPSRRAVVFTGGILTLIVIAVVGLALPATRAQAARTEEAQIDQWRRGSCSSCHGDPQTLLKTGGSEQNLDELVIEALPEEAPHARLDCVTCHHGDGTSDDPHVAHFGLVVDPTRGEAFLCVACHSDLPAEFPQDRLRTPHDAVSHGELVDVACSDCHGAAGHGFDPVSGEIICPMSVCLDCHISRQLDSTLTDCDACHVSSHSQPASLMCAACHQSTEEWASVLATAHVLDLTGAHAEVDCMTCHTLPAETGSLCADCHESPSLDHYGPQCEDCHTTIGFEQVQRYEHTVALEGAHLGAPCAGCHVSEGDTPASACADCHDAPAAHLSGACSSCHTPDGWAASIAWVVRLSPPLSHELDGRDDCLICHDTDGKVRPAPSNHRHYVNEQCLLCHKVD